MNDRGDVMCDCGNDAWYHDTRGCASCKACPATYEGLMRNEIVKLRAALRDYGRCNEGCSGPFGHPCKCGWVETQKQLLGGGDE